MARVAELFHDGGPVMIAIAVLSLLAWTIGLRALLHGVGLRRLFRDELALGRSERLVEHLRGEVTRLAASVKLVGTMAAALPLLGLLGTVIGMLVTFASMANATDGEPRLLADGIRQALLTTQAGLLSALVALLVRAGAERQVLRLGVRLDRANDRRSGQDARRSPEA